MTKAQHTPAPWETDEYGNEITAGNTIVARAHSTVSVSAKERKKFDVVGFDQLETIKANARLIAAAPELLETLRDAVIATASDHAEDPWSIRARAIITKAEGK